MLAVAHLADRRFDLAPAAARTAPSGRAAEHPGRPRAAGSAVIHSFSSTSARRCRSVFAVQPAAGSGTRCSCVRVPPAHRQLVAAVAYPAANAGGVADKPSRSRARPCVTTAPAPTKEYRPSVLPHTMVALAPMRRAPLDERLSVLVLARNVAARVDDVGEHHRRTAEDVVLEHHAGVDARRCSAS